MLKIKILSPGKIPGYPVNGPVLSPIWVKREEAMSFINAGLKVDVWIEELKEFKRFTHMDMIDLYKDKTLLEDINDPDHNIDGDCHVCDEVIMNVHELIKNTRVKQTGSGHSVVVENNNRILGDEPVKYIIEEPPVIEDDEIPDFGDAYEAPPFDVDAFSLDDFEDK
jgi:hypothetical protein